MMLVSFLPFLLGNLRVLSRNVSFSLCFVYACLCASMSTAKLVSLKPAGENLRIMPFRAPTENHVMRI